jgi:hypothetical protein
MQSGFSFKNFVAVIAAGFETGVLCKASDGFFKVNVEI